MRGDEMRWRLDNSSHPPEAVLKVTGRFQA